MFSKSNSGVMIDMLFNLLLTFVALFFLSFVMLNEPTEEESSDVTSDAQYIISMSWDVDADIDLWIEIPDGSKVYYGRREAGPVHLDLDVVGWRTYYSPDGRFIQMKNNQEIATIRGVMDGEYVINAHYFGGRLSNEDVAVQIVIQDVKKRNILWMGDLVLSRAGHEVHAVVIDIEDLGPNAFYPSNARVVENTSRYIVGR